MSLRQAQHLMVVQTSGKGLVEITRPVVDWVSAQGMDTGLLTLWCRHTSASLTVQENASPAVRADIAAFFESLAPEDPARYAHGDEGPDDMPAHLRAMLTGATMGIPVMGGRLVLGTWQGLYLFEHRRTSHRREVVLHLLGS